MPKTSPNAVLRCSMYSGCRSTCIEGHQFPNGQKALSIKCVGGEWEVEDSEWTEVPACERMNMK